MFCTGEKGEKMRKIKSYSSVWKFEKYLSSVGDLPLPIPVTFVQIAWFAGTFFAILFVFSKIPPLSYCNNVLFEYGVIPGGIAWFMSKKTFDGKRPYSWLKSFFLYFLRPKQTYAGKRVKYGKSKFEDEITIGRCYKYVPDTD